MTSRPNEADLIRRAQLGDRAAFEALVEEHGPGLYRYGLRMLGDEGTTQDCVQDTFLHAWTQLDGFRGDSSLSTWLFGIMANLVRREYRRRSRRPTAELSDDVPARRTDEPEQEVQRSALLRALEEALAELPPDQRACWILREVEGLSYEEIALVQATTVGGVRGRLARARESLGLRMERWR
ncbi:RNA polymerase subunit sigma-70 [Serinibacter arcticus]|uniref:RNA polymerase subunit sigma-70 n=1 Tax=Serinibacter arcticus TaxID=1655435 RepID=A0A2U1ZWN8_9MICO|nr:sigma-70 family RNA polymerase sigma factor [Serinibacter arcticus]PWD51332.1 RNA polymerase subunit sigma-70 [Serinibacter arcticus]